MKNKATVNQKVGSKIRTARQLKGFSQKEFAAELEITQQAVSKIENSVIVSPETLEKVSTVLGIPVETIVNFDEDAAFNNIIDKNETINQRCDVVNHYNSTDKVTELYERLLESEKQKNIILQQMLDLKNS